MDQWAKLPLFPLPTVLFPGMVLPLHIFEERYKLMINRCVKQDRPFGLVFIPSGLGTGAIQAPSDVGTTALIARVERLEEGRMNIVVVGGERFRLREISDQEPYLEGNAEPWPLVSALSREIKQQIGALRALFRLYLSLLSQAQGHKIQVEEIPTNARTLALLIAISLQLPMEQKQHLLVQPTIASMLQAEHLILRREQLLLTYMIRTQSEQWEGGSSGYLAKN